MTFDPRTSPQAEAQVGDEAEQNVSSPAAATEEGAPGAEAVPAENGGRQADENQDHSAQEAQDTEAQDHEAQVKRDLEELTAKASKAEQYLELAQRTQADFENYRKRALRDAAAAQERGIAKLAKELLPAVDNLDRALEAAESAARQAGENGGGPVVSGLKLVQADVVAALGRVGIEPYSPEGEPFDPQHHEAVAQQPVQGAEPGTVVEVYQRGYRLGDSVLRPARVVVAG
ncbi:MAG: nucleotide exchange factor GrpE [Solirubrobacterales bacterium]|nr:nucleotide exchange factor GrpE [Solirubrobacterales bacterium]